MKAIIYISIHILLLSLVIGCNQDNTDIKPSSVTVQAPHNALASTHTDSLEIIDFNIEKNHSKTWISRHPFVITRGIITFTDSLTPVFYVLEYLGLPQDSISLYTGKNLSLSLNKNSDGIYVNDYISYFKSENNLMKLFNKTMTLGKYFEEVKSDFLNGEQKIKNISGKNKRYAHALDYINQLKYYYYVFNMTNKNRPEFKQAMEFVKNQNQELQDFIHRKDIVLGDEYDKVVHYYIIYDLYVNGLEDNLVNYVKKVKEMNLPDLLILRAVSYLRFKHQETLDYTNAVDLLEKYAKEQKMESLLTKEKGLHFVTRDLKSLQSNVVLEDLKHKLTNLKDFISTSEKPYTIIDCWASWCSPCIFQIPYYEKMKKQFGNKVNFISLSVDKNKADWIQKSKELKLGADNYWLNKESQISLSRFFEITSIPRYILIAKDGRILNEEFYKPQEDSFSEEMKKLK